MSLRHTTVALTVGALVLSLAGPAAAAPKGKKWVEQQPEQTAEEVVDELEAYLLPELVDVPGSLFEVAASMGVVDGAPTGKGVTVALIDTGVSDVPALQGSNVTLGPDFSLDLLSGAEPARDRNGHGTHLASLIVGTDPAWAAGDTRRVPGRQLGIAPDANLLSIKVGAENGAVDVSQVIAAVNWVVDNKDAHDIRVLSLSYGTDGTQDWQADPLSYAVQRAWHAGIVVVVSTGNAGQDAAHLTNPAQNPWILAVGAADSRDGHWVDPGTGRAHTADFSQGSDGWLDWVGHIAPGRSIVGARLPGAYADQFNAAGRVGDDLVRGTGSSQSAALLAGFAAVLLEARPNLSPDELKDVLEMSGRKTTREDPAYQWAKFPNLMGALGQYAMYDLIGSSYAQLLDMAHGRGSLDAARGTQRIVVDGQPIAGEVDIFGQDFGDWRWTRDAWSGDTWDGHSWDAASYESQSWNGYSWNGYSWNGYSWNGYSWNGYSWNGYSWNGYSWNGYSWNGSSWT